MKSTTRRTVPYRRKREGRTNYKKRLELLKGKRHRLVIRRTNKHIIMQIIDYQQDGDHIITGVSSKTLEKHGWKHSGKNLSASYLTGLVLGQEAKIKGVTNAVLDIGLQTPKRGSKIYSALKGAIDAGLVIPVNEEVFPSEERIQGKHISEDITASFNKVKQTITGARS